MADGEGDIIPSSSLYKDNPEWKDVTPIYPCEAENAAVSIKHDKEFIDAFAYLRAVLQSGEKSERALRLTEDCIDKNAANYTLWQYRRDLLRHLNKDLVQELNYLEDIILENSKNYQVWHHRRAIIEWLGDASRELSFTRLIIQDEQKNYHAWQHRQWVVRRFELPVQPELDYANELLVQDARNNSAWNYRYFLLQLSGRISDKDTLESEFKIVKQIIGLMPHSESVWTYLAGLLMDNGLASRPDIIEYVKELYEKTEREKRSPHMVSFLVDVHNEKIAEGEGIVENAEEAKKLLDELISLDSVRSNYWCYQKLVVESSLQKALLASA